MYPQQKLRLSYCLDLLLGEISCEMPDNNIDTDRMARTFIIYGVDVRSLPEKCTFQLQI